MRHFFQVDEKDAAQIENLSKRMQRLVYGAVDYNSLIQPGRTLTYKLYMGEKWQYPRLTDTSTLSGDITEQMGLVPFMVFKATSVSRNQTDFSPHYFAGDDQILDHNVRHILLTAAPWYLAGIAGYLLVSWICLEPSWKRRIFNLIVAVLVLRIFFLSTTPEAYNGFLPWLAVCTLLTGTFSWLSIVRFKEGKQD